MRHKLIWLLAMAAVLVLSFWLPDAAAVLQERKMRAEHQHETLDNPSLTAEKKDGSLEVLALQQGIYNGIELETGRVMDAVAAQRAAVEAAQMLASYGLLPVRADQLGAAETECWPALIADAQAQTAIFWNALLRIDEAEFVLSLALDDSSGQIVRFEYTSIDLEMGSGTEKEDAADNMGFDGGDVITDGGFDPSAAVDDLTAMLQEHYGAQSVELEERMDLAPEYDAAGTEYPGCQLVFHVTGQEGYELELPVQLWGSGTQIFRCLFNIWA